MELHFCHIYASNHLFEGYQAENQIFKPIYFQIHTKMQFQFHSKSINATNNFGFTVIMESYKTVANEQN